MRRGPMIYFYGPFYYNTIKTKQNNMPYRMEYEPAELFLQYDGIRVVHTYKDNDMENGPQRNWYALDGWDEEVYFDIRETLAWAGMHKYPPFMDKPENKTEEVEQAWVEYHDNEDELHRSILRRVIDTGELEHISQEKEQPYERN